MKVSNQKFRQIFVEADDPSFLENDVKPQRDFVDVNSLDITKIREYRIARQKGYSTTPFDPEGKMFRTYPGGYTVWSGYPGAGKTTLLRQLVCHQLHRGQGVFVACMEEKVMQIFDNHSCVALGTQDPPQSGYEWCAFHWQDKLRLWSNEQLPAPHRRMLAGIRVLAKQGVRHAVIDSLMCLDVSGKDIDQQKDFANALKETCDATNIHVHLVAHPRKIISIEQAPDMNDVAGAADIVRLADNIVFVRRMKDDGMVGAANASPMRVSILKQRYFNGQIGDITGWLNRDTKQYKTEQFDDSRTAYLPPQAYLELTPIAEPESAGIFDS